MDGQPAPRRKARRPLHPIAAAVMAASLATTGCQGMAMTTQDVPPEEPARPDNTVADWPLKFVQHNFGAFCYSTYGCRVRYNGFDHTADPDGELALSSESLGDRYPDNLGGGYLGILNFPPPAQVRWRSKDGTSHEAEVDIGEIFRDQLILHDVPREDVREGVSILNPEIVLEVNDRTINVYMRAFIPTKALQQSGNPHSGHRDELLLAWSRTY
ncbi:hypothetical protein FZO89_09020 [Luteimonas viscosa]|uniref:Uncharacterized protein n=1 Tax=Luteimonas viscosa TaxID=1132694 RepID=A0A5D4XNY1_9GAMM|nr:hypothetical protein [Luteimonas viscosa]TYT26388.1 hypothetical protein FZO89_09020 [Luteimonas viscosa]